MYSPMGIGDDTSDLPIPGSGPVNTAVLPAVSVGTAVAGSGCPIGSTCSYFPGVPDAGVYTLVGVLVGIILIGAYSGHR